MGKAFKCDVCGQFFEGHPWRDEHTPIKLTGALPFTAPLGKIQICIIAPDVCKYCVFNILQAFIDEQKGVLT
jgi:hypothetical protein